MGVLPKMSVQKKHDRFIAAYLSDPNASKAAAAAGYKAQNLHSCGCKLLKNPYVAKKLEEAHKKAQKKAGFDAVWIRKKLKKLHDDCEARNDEIKYRQLQAKCLTDMARMEAMFIDKTEHSGQVAVDISVSTGIDRG